MEDILHVLVLLELVKKFLDRLALFLSHFLIIRRDTFEFR